MLFGKQDLSAYRIARLTVPSPSNSELVYKTLHTVKILKIGTP